MTLSIPRIRLPLPLAPCWISLKISSMTLRKWCHLLQNVTEAVFVPDTARYQAHSLRQYCPKLCASRALGTEGSKLDAG